MISKKDMLQNEEILSPVFGDPPNIGLAWRIHFLYINPAMPEKIPYILVSGFQGLHVRPMPDESN